MAAGVYYDDPFKEEKELYAIETGYRYKGGFNLDIEGLPKGKEIPVLCPLVLDFAERKAHVVVNLKVYERATSGTTSVKIHKGSFAKVGGKYMLAKSNYIEVSAIDTSNEEYDVLTVGETSAEIAAGAVLTEANVSGSSATAVRSATALNYARTKIEDGATVTALGRAYEIKEAELFVPLTAADKASLTSRFMFV